MVEAQPNRVMYGKTLVELGETLNNLIVIDADLSKSTNTYQFKYKFPERFLNVGIAEQNGVSFAAGLSTVGKIVFFSTFAVFASMRACDQIRQAIAYPEMNVKIVATSAGVENNADGVSHQAIEDMAIMRSIPNIVVLSPSDPVTTRKATIAAAMYCGPVYMRLGRHDSNVLHDENVDFRIGKMIRLAEGNDISVIATGRMVEEALKASAFLLSEGISVRVLDCHTIKPIDKEEIILAVKETRGIVTVEDHNIIGGLGSAVCEVVCGEYPAIVKRIGLNDEFACSGRDYKELLSHYGMCSGQIIDKVHEILER